MITVYKYYAGQGLFLFSYSMLRTQDFWISAFVIFALALIGYSYSQSHLLGTKEEDLDGVDFKFKIWKGFITVLFLTSLIITVANYFSLNFWLTMMATLLVSSNPTKIETYKEMLEEKILKK